MEELRKQAIDIHNRLHSIHADSAFVAAVHDAYPSVPLVPNLRCGAWYTDPTIAAPIPAYFKSTDGHFNNWSFNLRRANLHLLPLVANAGGIILVDSTRAGKKIPDALSKTVPIWCAVINRAIPLRYHPQEEEKWDTALYTPPGTVSPQEHHQIEQRLDAWAIALANSSFDLPRLPCPLRPLWITPSTTAFPALPEPRTFLPVICLSASKQCPDALERRAEGYVYVQGSGDDHELWGRGLTPALYWAHRDRLLDAGSRDDLESLVDDIVAEVKERHGRGEEDGHNQPSPIKHVNGSLLLAKLSDIPHSALDRAEEEDLAYILLLPPGYPHENNSQSSDPKHIFTIPQTPSKKGQSRFLDQTLPTAIQFIRHHLTQHTRICVACESGKDQSVGVVLTALQSFFNPDGSLQLDSTAIPCTKQTIRTRLEWIIASRPESNPSRATLKRINEFLLTPTSFLSPSSSSS